MKTLQKILTLFIGIGAVAGAVMMWVDPVGTTWGGEPLLEMLRAKMPWPDVFFKNFVPSGFVLLGLNGITQFVAAYLLFKKHRLAQHAVLACGIILMLWIVLEWWVWGFNALSNIFFVLGLVETITVVIILFQTKKIMTRPNPNEAFPNPKIPSLCYIKNVVKNPNIIVGDYTYYDDVDGADQFEKHVTHFYNFIGDKLIIGKFCAIAKGVEFVMNGANHRMDCATTYPFYIMGGDWGSAIAPVKNELPLKGDTIVGNDVWIGQHVIIIPGVHIGDGAIIGTNSVVASDIPPYAIAVGNPCHVVKKRFDDELIELLLKFKWWDKPIEEIENLMPILSCGDLEKVRKEIKARLKVEFI